jgi:hypothetical protein
MWIFLEAPGSMTGSDEAGRAIDFGFIVDESEG